MDYRRASKKQLAYIATLCQQLDMINPTLYDKYSLEQATRLIAKLKRKQESLRNYDRQIRLL